MRPKIFGAHDAGTLEQFEAVADTARFAALMADGHYGYSMPVGGVAAWDNRVSIEGVGVDIACGNCAIRTDRLLEEFTPNDIRELADEIYDTFSFGAGGVNQAPDAPGVEAYDILDQGCLAYLKGPSFKEVNSLRDHAVNQLGTIGGGNHYVDVLVDRGGFLWVGVHFGSRGLGYQLSNNFLAMSQGEPWGAEPSWDRNGAVHLDNPIGQDYWHVMELAGKYAYAGREWVARKVVSILGGEETDMVHNHHNFAWKESHHGEEVVVVRKGATPAFPGQRGFVGGSMGDDAVILRGASPESGGREHWIQRQALYSTVHGAGRTMSRRQAKKEYTVEQMREWIDEVGVIVRGGGLDESPMAYRRLSDVLSEQGPTIEIEKTLTPVVVCMAPS